MDMGKLKFGFEVSANTESKREVLASLGLGSKWMLECYSREGKLKWQTPWSPNKMTEEGMTHFLNVVLHGDTPITEWFVVPFENDYTPTGEETYAVPGYTECTAYSEENRVAFNEAAAADLVITNSANKATYNMTSTKTVYGAALVGGGTAASTKGDTAGGGIIICLAPFSSPKPCDPGDTLKITGAVSAQDFPAE